MIAKLNLASLLAALIAFAFPWLELRCSNEPMLTQTGIQILYGGATPAGALAEMVKENPEKADDPDRPDSAGASILVGIALLATLGALVFGFLALRRNRSGDLLRSGALAAVALAALLAQLAAGFPLKDQIDQDTGSSTANNPFSRLASAALRVEVVHRPAFYIELAALGLPVLIFGNSLLEKLRRPIS
ncbi:hypothetical protein BH23VER1_BH23VER1_00320 [soil metagenome]